MNGISQILNNWSTKLGKEYPEDLKMTVIVKIRRDGVVVGRDIETLSEEEDFNIQVLKTISNSAPFPPFPEEMKVEQLEFGFNFNPSNMKS